MKLDKNAIIPALEKNKAMKANDDVYSLIVDGVKCGIDFKKNEFFWMDDLTRMSDDSNCEELKKFKEICLGAMFSKNKSSGEPSKSAPSDATDKSASVEETDEEGYTNTEYDNPPHESFVPAPVTQRQVAAAHSVDFTPDQIDTIRNTVAKGATDDELAMFMHLANTYGLDPFLKEIFYSSQMKTIITSRDGYLKVAQRDPEFDGIQSMAVCENDDFSIDMVNNVVNHSFGKGDRGSVIGAWAVCYRKGRRPVIAYADYNEYNKNNPIWKTYKSAMCCKVAEVFALKRQFGISGLVTQEEMGVEA
jgi:phage recombination protein Bet